MNSTLTLKRTEVSVEVIYKHEVIDNTLWLTITIEKPNKTLTSKSIEETNVYDVVSAFTKIKNENKHMTVINEVIYS